MYLVPLARRFRWFDQSIGWVSLPFVFVERIATKVRRKAPPEEHRRKAA